MIGVPAGSFSCPASGMSYYFVAMKSGNTPVANQRPLPFEGLKMGQQLGRGPRAPPCAFPPCAFLPACSCCEGAVVPNKLAVSAGWCGIPASEGSPRPPFLLLCKLGNCAPATWQCMHRYDLVRWWLCRLVWPRLQGHIPGSQGGCQGKDSARLLSR